MRDDATEHMGKVVVVFRLIPLNFVSPFGSGTMATGFRIEPGAPADDRRTEKFPFVQ
jgi:hypothetical protein